MVQDHLFSTPSKLRQATWTLERVTRFVRRSNQIFELHDCPWRISDGEFFKLDADFVGAKLAATGHNTLAANQFAGAELVPALDHMLISRFSQALYRYSIVVPMMVLVYSAAATTL